MSRLQRSRRASSGRARRPRRDAAQWQALIERQAGSRLSVRAFCRRHDLNEASFYDWRQRLGRRRVAARATGDSGIATAPSAGFVRVEPSGGQPSSLADVVEVRFACGTTLHCPGHRLAELVALLNAGHGGLGSC